MLHNLLLAMNRVNLTEPFISFEVFLASKGYNYSESEIFIYLSPTGVSPEGT